MELPHGLHFLWRAPSRNKILVVLVSVVVFAGLLFFWRLSVHPLENWDEAIHAEVTSETYHKGSWLTLSYRDEFYAAKPPLKFWITAPLLPVFGEHPVVFRFWSAVAGVATAVLLTLWGWEMSRRKLFAFLAGALFVVGRFTFFHAFRTGETDGLLIFFFTAALYAVWKTRENARWILWSALMCGFAIMTKSLAGLLPLITAALYLTLERQWQKLGWRRVLEAAGIFLLVTVPWHAYELLTVGTKFWNSYVSFHVVARASEALFGNTVPWYWYATVIHERYFPFAVGIVLALLFAGRRAIRGNALDRLLLLWVIVVFAVYSAVQTKFDWYILPIYPALTLLLVRFLAHFSDERRFVQLSAAFLFIAGSIAIVPMHFVHQGLVWWMTPFAYLPESMTHFLPRIVVGLVLAGILVAGTLRFRSRASLAVLATGCMLWLGLLAFGWQLSYLRHVPTTTPLLHIVNDVAQRSIPHIEVIGVHLVENPAAYFTLRNQTSVQFLEYPDRFVDRPRGPYVLTTDDPRFAPIVARGTVVENSERYLLVQIPATQ